MLTDSCLQNGIFYDHGDIVSMAQCVECECIDGSMQCKRIDPKTCPNLSCPLEDRFTVEGECCQFCPGT